MPDTKHIAEKLVRVMASCRYVQKDRANDFLRYRYASAAAVLEKVNAACVENNLATVVNSRVVSQSEKTSRSGAIETLVTVQTEVTLIDGDSGELVTFTGLGSGQDVGDKAVAKAQTMALKYAWMTTLNISTGDDPEADSHVDERAFSDPAEEERSSEPSATGGDCPECGASASLVETEEVVGMTVGIYRCSNPRCPARIFRRSMEGATAKATALN